MWMIRMIEIEGDSEKSKLDTKLNHKQEMSCYTFS